LADTIIPQNNINLLSSLFLETIRGGGHEGTSVPPLGSPTRFPQQISFDSLLNNAT